MQIVVGFPEYRIGAAYTISGNIIATGFKRC